MTTPAETPIVATGPTGPTGQVFDKRLISASGPNTYTFRLSPTDVAYANTLRRLIITAVETVAFRSDIDEQGKTGDIVILRNSTPMTNEMLADRIGLIPITVPEPRTWDSEKYEFRLDITNNSPHPRDVLVSDIQVIEKAGENGEEKTVPNTSFFLPDPITQQTILLAVLKGKTPNRPAESMAFRAKATKGVGRKHVRFNPVALCTYKYTRDENKERREQLFQQWIRDKKYLKPEQDYEKLDTIKKELWWKEYNTMQADRCYLVDSNGNPYSFDFTVETIGTMSVPQIINRALEAGVALCRKYENLEPLPPNVRQTPAANLLEGFDYIFENEDHTLGNLLQSYIESNLMKDGSTISYVGYNVPHPLRDEMVLRIGIVGGKDIDARRVIMTAVRGCIEMFTSWSQQWQREVGMVRPTLVRKRPVAVASVAKKIVA